MVSYYKKKPIKLRFVPSFLFMFSSLNTDLIIYVVKRQQSLQLADE